MFSSLNRLPCSSCSSQIGRHGNNGYLLRCRLLQGKQEFANSTYGTPSPKEIKPSRCHNDKPTVQKDNQGVRIPKYSHSKASCIYLTRETYNPSQHSQDSISSSSPDFVDENASPLMRTPENITTLTRITLLSYFYTVQMKHENLQQRHCFVQLNSCNSCNS